MGIGEDITIVKCRFYHFAKSVIRVNVYAK